MTQNNHWKFKWYFEYKDRLNILADEQGYTLPDVMENITFVLPMPKSWSKKKRQEFDNKPHQQKPDLDNIVKAFMDCLSSNDCNVHTYNNVRKIWGESGSIIIDV
jgi:Holliday junction resolvase RusA-like endonuclease